MKSSVEYQPSNIDAASGLSYPLHNIPLCMGYSLGAFHSIWHGF